MSSAADDPRCPECGEPIGQTATYCMHCSADLTEEREAADADDDGTWDSAEAGPAAAGETHGGGGATAGTGGAENAGPAGESAGGTGAGQLLAPDGLVDNTLTVVVGIAGGIVVGVVGTVVLLIVTGSAWAVGFGVIAWLAATAYLVRRRTVQEAVSKGSYAVALVLLSIPVIALSPVADIGGGVEERGGFFVVLLIFVAFPAGIAAVVGWIASRFVPEAPASGEV